MSNGQCEHHVATETQFRATICPGTVSFSWNLQPCLILMFSAFAWGLWATISPVWATAQWSLPDCCHLESQTGEPDGKQADLLCMHKSITQSMCMHCTSTAFHNPEPAAHTLYWATAQISALHFTVLVLKFILEYLLSFLCLSSFVQTRTHDYCYHNVFEHWCLWDKRR